MLQNSQRKCNWTGMNEIIKGSYPVSSSSRLFRLTPVVVFALISTTIWGSFSTMHTNNVLKLAKCSSSKSSSILSLCSATRTHKHRLNSYKISPGTGSANMRKRAKTLPLTSARSFWPTAASVASAGCQVCGIQCLFYLFFWVGTMLVIRTAPLFDSFNISYLWKGSHNVLCSKLACFQSKF